MIGTLTSSIANPVHTSTSPLLVYSLNLPYLENYVRIVTLTPGLLRVSFYGITDFLHHSSTTELPTIPDTHKEVLSKL